LAATNRNLAHEVEAGRFREDLFYRINVMSLELPPLRERTGDIPLLVERFLGPDWQLEPAAAERIQEFSWPGNVRQLINALERAKIMADGGTIRLKDLPREVSQGETRRVESREVDHSVANDLDDLASIQRHKIVEVLRREACNKSRAAKVLGIDRRKLYRLLEKYAIADAELFGNGHPPPSAAAAPL
jgi:transcriptional regulator with PAS, ATPase and Fis domain